MKTRCTFGLIARIAMVTMTQLTIPIGAQLIFSGLTHEAIGDAALDFDAQGELVVSNLGSSGEDGVAVLLGTADSHLVSFESTGAATLPTGSSIIFTTWGELDGQPDQSIWTVRIKDLGERFGLALDTTRVRSGSLRVEAWLADAVVDGVVFNPPPPPDTILASFYPTGCILDPFLPEPPECLTVLELAEPGTITLTGGSGSVTADKIVVASVGQQGVVTSLSQTWIQASGVPELRILDETLGLFGQEHQTTGQAIFGAQSDRLTISNIGSSGDDGVTVLLDEAERFVALLEPLSLANSSSALTLRTTGKRDGVSGQPLTEARLKRVGDNLQVITDYAAIGADLVRVEVWNDGVLVGTTTVADGVVGEITGVPQLKCGSEDIEPPCIGIAITDDVVFTAADATVLIGDEIRLPAANATSIVTSLASFTIEAADIDAFTLVGESTFDPGLVFTDGFESGDVSTWSASVP